MPLARRAVSVVATLAVIAGFIFPSSLVNTVDCYSSVFPVTRVSTLRLPNTKGAVRDEI